MTVSILKNRDDYTGNGSLSSYPYQFKIFEDTDLEVYRIDTLENDTLLTFNVDYTVTGAGNATGGTVELTVELPLNYKLAIVRVLPLTQPTAFRNQGAFYPARHEDAADRQVMISQQIQEQIGRSLLAPVGIDTDLVSLDFPGPDGDHIIGWNAAGTALENKTGIATQGMADLASITDAAKGTALVGFLPDIIGGFGRTLYTKLFERISLLDTGAVGDGSTDDSDALEHIINHANLAGNIILDGCSKEFLLNTKDIVINNDYIFIMNARFKRTSTRTGWVMRWATANDTVGGGIINCNFEGRSDVSANAGLGFGIDLTYSADKFILENVIADGFSQYGIGIGLGNDWVANNITILNHGLTSGAISSCMGFYVFPGLVTVCSGGKLTNVYSEISSTCQSNASANAAALKLEQHQDLIASNMVLKGGREQVFSLSMTAGAIVSKVKIYPQTNRPGLIVEDNYAITGRSFTVDDIEIIDGGDLDFIIAAVADGSYTLRNAILRNIKGKRTTVLNRSSIRDCHLENIDFEEIAWSTNANGYLVNSAVPTGNIYKNVIVRGGTYFGKFAIDANNSLFIGCGNFPLSGETVDYFNLFGSSNILKDQISVGSVSHGIQIEGNNNYISHPFVQGQTDRTVLFKVGTSGNVLSRGFVSSGIGILDLGSNSFEDTLYNLLGSAAPVAGTWRVGDRILNSAPAATGWIGWVCTVAGTPGTWKGYGAIEA